LAREDILSAARKHGGDEPASPFMRAGVDSVRPSAPVESVFERLQGRGAAALHVTDPDGKIIGLLTRQTVGEVMMIRAAGPTGGSTARLEAVSYTWLDCLVAVPLQSPTCGSRSEGQLRA
jgi:hypothetical protein